MCRLLMCDKEGCLIPKTTFLSSPKEAFAEFVEKFFNEITEKVNTFSITSKNLESKAVQSGSDSLDCKHSKTKIDEKQFFVIRLVKQKIVCCSL